MTRIAVSLVLTTLAAVSWTSVGLAAPGRPAGEGRTFTRGGVTIWYEVMGGGTGRPLVVVNGGPGFDHTYLRVSDAWDQIARARPVVMYDQRGIGRSGALPEGTSCTLVDQIDDLEALRAELGRETIDLLGHSWGGLLAMAYAARHPGRVAHLVIADSAAPKWTDTEFIFKYTYPETVQRQGVFDALDAVGDQTAHSRSMREYMSMLCVSRARSDELVAASADFAYSRRINEILNADLAQHDLGPALATFGMPTLVVTGRFDINVAPSTAWKIHQAVPGSRFVVFEKSGHLPFFEEPEAWVRVIEDFLGDHAAPSTNRSRAGGRPHSLRAVGRLPRQHNLVRTRTTVEIDDSEGSEGLDFDLHRGVRIAGPGAARSCVGSIQDEPARHFGTRCRSSRRRASRP